MKQLYNLIQDFRKGNTDALIHIIKRFNPQLNKYQINSSYDDMKSDLILFMFKLINKIPLEKDIFKEDKYIISYVSKSLKNQYIYLNKINCNIISKEISLDEKYINKGDYNCFGNIIFEDLINGLTDIEKDVIIKIYKFNYSKAEVAKINGVSRQAIHKTHDRALSKIKKTLI